MWACTCVCTCVIVAWFLTNVSWKRAAAVKFSRWFRNVFLRKVIDLRSAGPHGTRTRTGLQGSHHLLITMWSLLGFVWLFVFMERAGESSEVSNFLLDRVILTQRSRFWLDGPGRTGPAGRHRYVLLFTCSEWLKRESGANRILCNPDPGFGFCLDPELSAAVPSCRTCWFWTSTSAKIKKFMIKT